MTNDDISRIQSCRAIQELEDASEYVTISSVTNLLRKKQMTTNPSIIEEMIDYRKAWELAFTTNWDGTDKE